MSKSKFIEQKKAENYKLGLLYEMLLDGKGSLDTIVSGIRGLPRYDKHEILQYIKKGGDSTLKDALAEADPVAQEMFGQQKGGTSLEQFRGNVDEAAAECSD